MARLRVGPALLPAFVPAVVEQAGFGVAGVLLHPHELVGDVVEGLGLLEQAAVLGVKRLGHVQSVEPHLIGVALFVPKAALFRAGLLGKLLPEQVGGLAVLLAVGEGLLGEQQQGPARCDVVDVELVQLVRADAAVGLHVAVHRALDEVEVAGVGGAVPHPFDAPQQHAGFVIPAVRFSFFHVRHRIAVGHEHGVGHAQRPGELLGQRGRGEKKHEEQGAEGHGVRVEFRG